jgi:hypothetical protein
MRIALATCSRLPDWERDDEALRAALRARGAEPVDAVWDDPSVAWGSFDACLIRTTWDYAERRDEFVAWSERVADATLLLHGPELVRWNTHKSYLRDLERRGVPIVPTIWIDRGERVDPASILAERGWARGFLKPVVGSTARETLPFEAGECGAARAHLERMLAAESMMLQPYLSRVETEGECSIVFLGGEVTHAVRKVPVPGDYRVQDDFGAADFPHVPTHVELRFARGAVESVGAPLLYARVDTLRDDGGQLRLVELEIVEPLLFFRHAPHAAGRLAEALLDRVRRRARPRSGPVGIPDANPSTPLLP